ncbi:MAG: hypothetical protein B6I25_08450 [Planctomycetales bacterium 4572_13]|nr:MAG: hypothetical protein B6I25_08450 [Planctomycetales bacterium 4572_13]
MTIPNDFKELLELLNLHKIDYIIVGAYALALHGHPRFTGDLDIYVKPDIQNASQVVSVLEAFGFGSLQLGEDDFNRPHRVVQLGVSPVRIDLLTSLTGLTWDQAICGQLKGELGGVPVTFLGRAEYIQNKRALGRHKDIADAETLEE